VGGTADSFFVRSPSVKQIRKSKESKLIESKSVCSLFANYKKTAILLPKNGFNYQEIPAFMGFSKPLKLFPLALHELTLNKLA
jgi:hypothetical protein